ncbi:MAG: ABC transporter substrate-binding protein [Flavipsychrobacter sp.]|nr:ABC transporter substrate-binding protein [Flavipsychrobacter sp.]
MKRKLLQGIAFSLAILVHGSCGEGGQAEQKKESTDEQTRIVSLSGTTTEVLCALGVQDKLVATDVTSYYPAAVAGLPKVGHNRNISAEAILAQRPTLVVALREQTKPDLVEQLQTAHVRVLLLDMDYSVAGTKKLVAQLADSLGVTGQVGTIHAGIDRDMAGLAPANGAPKVLFIYARGAGTMMVAGEHTPAASMIAIAGARNAVSGFEDFKPLTAEALVAANPDVILMFDKGLESLGGIDGLLNVPGVKETSAGKHRRVIEMDGQLLTGFGPRVGAAASELANKLNALNAN